MLTGSCLCGKVRYRVSGKLGPLAYCHCTECQRASGTAFAANAPVRARYLEFASGRDAIREYESSPGKFRAFCSGCGSPLYSRVEADPDTFRLRVGCLDGDPERRPIGHFWVSDAAAWHEIDDELPRFERDLPADHEWNRS